MTHCITSLNQLIMSNLSLLVCYHSVWVDKIHFNIPIRGIAGESTGITAQPMARKSPFHPCVCFTGPRHYSPYRHRSHPCYQLLATINYQSISTPGSFGRQPFCGGGPFVSFLLKMFLESFLKEAVMFVSLSRGLARNVAPRAWRMHEWECYVSSVDVFEKRFNGVSIWSSTGNNPNHTFLESILYIII